MIVSFNEQFYNLIKATQSRTDKSFVEWNKRVERKPQRNRAESWQQVYDDNANDRVYNVRQVSGRKQTIKSNLNETQTKPASAEDGLCATNKSLQILVFSNYYKYI